MENVNIGSPQLESILCKLAKLKKVALYQQELIKAAERYFKLLFKTGKAGATVACYQCGEPVNWLAPDSRCKHCTRYIPDEISLNG